MKTFRTLMEEMLAVIGRKRLLVSLPWPVAGMIGSLLGILPNPLLTRDQVTMLKSDNVVSAEAISEGRDFAAIGIDPQAADAILPSYLWQYRKAGQFTRPNAA